MTPPIVIRKATLQDTFSIYSFICELEEEIFDLEQFKVIFSRNLQNPDCHYLLAFEADIPVGYASVHVQWLLHHCGKVGEIQEMFVAQSHRNKGIGRLLFDVMLGIAQQQKCDILEVTANQKRIDTHRFYESQGLLKTHFKFVRKL
jgi:PhnO protein